MPRQLLLKQLLLRQAFWGIFALRQEAQRADMRDCLNFRGKLLLHGVRWRDA
jgi:hypothetical protein